MGLKAYRYLQLLEYCFAELMKSSGLLIEKKILIKLKVFIFFWTELSTLIFIRFIL